MFYFRRLIAIHPKQSLTAIILFIKFMIQIKEIPNKKVVIRQYFDVSDLVSCFFFCVKDFKISDKIEAFLPKF